MRSHRLRRRGLGIALLVAGVWANTAVLHAQQTLPGAPPDAVSEASFARELIPVLLGRRPRGSAEVALVAQVSTLLGREAATRMLMRQPDFVSHWSEGMIDLIEVQRSGLPASKECFGAPLRAEDDGGALAAFVHDNPPTVQPGGAAYNMADLIRSAIQLDDLSPIYQAYVFPISARRWGSDTPSTRASVADQFLRVYLSRDIGCLGCHNRSFSLSNKQDGAGNVVWQRLWAVPANIEKALFGNFADSAGTRERLDLLFRGDVRTSATSAAGFRPWGLDTACTTEYPQSSIYASTGAFRTPTGSDQPAAHFGSIDGVTAPRASVIELEQAFRNGVTQLSLAGLELSTPPPTAVTTPAQAHYCGMVGLTSDTCSACHSGQWPAGNLDLSVDPATATAGVVASLAGYAGAPLVVPGDPAASVLYQLVASGAMPPGATTNLSAGDVGLVESWIAAGAPSGDPALCSASHVPEVPPDPAFAYLVAEGVVDRIWRQVMGSRLTIDHGFPRNAAQLQTLWTLTEDVFLPGRWSLADVLVAIVTSDLFVRSTPADGGPEPYPLPLLWDPWVEADPTLAPPVDPEHATLHNGPGELARRRDAGGMVRAAITALDWTRPIRFPVILTPWPGQLEAAMGRYASIYNTGFADIDFQSLLHWEARVGTCANHGSGDEDWITRLLSAIQAHDMANPTAPLTLREAYLVLKDWLVQDPTLATQLPPSLATVPGSLTEEQALLGLFNGELPLDGQVPLEATKTQVGDLFLETKLREACGILLKSPAFMMGHIAPASYAAGIPPPPRLRVCNAEPCQPSAMCNAFRDDLAALGQAIECTTAGVPILPSPEPAPPTQNPALTKRAKRLAALCPKGRCAFVPWQRVGVCDKQPSLCRKPPLPDCDPRFVTRQGCGALPLDPGTPGLLRVRGDGAVVDHARGVGIARPGANRWQALRARTKLRVGDVLQVPSDAELFARDRQGSFGTPPVSQRLPGGKPRAVIAGPALPPYALEKRSAEIEMPFYLQITGSEPSSIRTRGPRTLDTRALRAGIPNRQLQPRAPAASQRAQLALRAARPSVRRGAHAPSDPAHVHVLTPPGMTSEATPRPETRHSAEVRFSGRGVQSLFCPGQPALRCTPTCRVALEEAPKTCGVLGTARGQKLSGELRIQRPGIVKCAWRKGRLGCR